MSTVSHDTRKALDVFEVSPIVRRNEAARILKVHPRTVSKMIDRGVLRSTVGVSPAGVTGRSLVEFLEANEVPAKVTV